MAPQRRLQLVLDQQRYSLVAREAQRSGRSVAAVIREAIDARFPEGSNDRERSLGAFLALTSTPDDEYEDWQTIKDEVANDIDRWPGTN